MVKEMLQNNHGEELSASKETTKVVSDLMKEDEKQTELSQGATYKTMHRRLPKKIIVICLLILTFLVGIGLTAFFQTKSLFAQVKSTEEVGRKVYDAIKLQDLVLANQELESLKSELTQTDQKLQQMRWLSYIPLAGTYWKDSDRVMKASEAGVDAVDIL